MLGVSPGSNESHLSGAVSPFKGIKPVTDSWRSMKREGGVVVELHTPSKRT